MLKIEISENREVIEGKGKATTVMAEMMMAVHAFYNNLNESNKKCFKRSFLKCFDDVFCDRIITDDDVNKACDKQEQEKEPPLDELIEALDSLKSILKELGE